MIIDNELVFFDETPIASTKTDSDKVFVGDAYKPMFIYVAVTCDEEKGGQATLTLTAYDDEAGTNKKVITLPNLLAEEGKGSVSVSLPFHKGYPYVSLSYYSATLSTYNGKITAAIVADVPIR